MIKSRVVFFRDLIIQMKGTLPTRAHFNLTLHSKIRPNRTPNMLEESLHNVWYRAYCKQHLYGFHPDVMTKTYWHTSFEFIAKGISNHWTGILGENICCLNFFLQIRIFLKWMFWRKGFPLRWFYFSSVILIWLFFREQIQFQSCNE